MTKFEVDKFWEEFFEVTEGLYEETTKTHKLQLKYVGFLKDRGYRYKPQKKQWRYRTMVKRLQNES